MLKMDHIQQATTPLHLSRAGHLRWDDEALHQEAYQSDPELYALLALAPDVQNWQRARILLQILRQSHRGLKQRQLLSQIAKLLLMALPTDISLTVLLTLRRQRANHKHVTRAILYFIAEHPHIDWLLASRRPSLRDCFEHALGKSTARTCVRMLTGEIPTDLDYLDRHLMRFVDNADVMTQRIPALYAPAANITASEETLPETISLDDTTERPKTITPTNRGDIAATLVHLYRGGPTAELEAAVACYVDIATKHLPTLAAKVALVFDASASMRSYGLREYAILSQAMALKLVMERCCPQLEIIWVGGDDGTPYGHTDLASGLLDALATQPNLVVIVSDGYENVYPGDLSRVTATLPLIGVDTPIVFCHSAFTGSDDLTWRRPAPELPERLFWHQADFDGLLLWMFSHTDSGIQWVRTMLTQQLEQLEQDI